MNWLWTAIIITAGLAVCAGIYRAQCERDAERAEAHDARNEWLEGQLREAHAAACLADAAKVKHLRDNRAELTALWNDQRALLQGQKNGDFADWYVMRLWHRNREYWGWIIAGKGRIVPDEMSA